MKVLVVILLLCVISCRSVQYVPVETVKHDSIYINKVQYDSIYNRDSVYLERAGDTVYLYKYKYIYKYKNLTDTMYVTKTDSIQIAYPVEIIKEKYRVPKFLWWLVILLAGLSVPSILKILRKLKVIKI